MTIFKWIKHIAVIGGIIIIALTLLSIYMIDEQANQANQQQSKNASKPKTELIYEYHNSKRLIRIYRHENVYQLITYHYTNPKGLVSEIKQIKETQYRTLPKPHLPDDKTNWVYSYQNRKYPRAN